MVFAKFKITSEKPRTVSEVEKEKIAQTEKLQEIERQKIEQNKQKQLMVEKEKKRKERQESWNNFFSNIDILNAQYHYNRNYNLIDLGFRWAEIDEDDGYGGSGAGASLGWYWKNENKKGICLTANAGIAYKWFYGALDFKTGIGQGSFVAFQPRIGVGINGVIYCTGGYEFATKSRPSFGIQAGLNIPLHSD